MAESGSLLGVLIAAVGVLALLTLVPGPDMAVVTRISLASGRGAAARAAAGIATGLLLWGLLAVGGLAAVLAASAKAYTAVRLAGAAYLVVLGVRTLWGTRRMDHVPVAAAGANGEAFRVGLVTNLLNPKIAVFYSSLLPQLVPPGAPEAATLAALVAVHVALSLFWLNLYALLLEWTKTGFQRPGVRRALETATGAVLIAAGLRVAAQQR